MTNSFGSMFVATHLRITLLNDDMSSGGDEIVDRGIVGLMPEQVPYVESDSSPQERGWTTVVVRPRLDEAGDVVVCFDVTLANAPQRVMSWLTARQDEDLRLRLEAWSSSGQFMLMPLLTGQQFTVECLATGESSVWVGWAARPVQEDDTLVELRMNADHPPVVT